MISHLYYLVNRKGAVPEEGACGENLAIPPTIWPPEY